MISLLSSKTDIPVPSNETRVGSFWDLKRKNTEDDMAQKRHWMGVGAHSQRTAVGLGMLILAAVWGNVEACDPRGCSPDHRMRLGL